MQRLKVVGLTLVAVFAISALTATGAMAEPWKEFVSTPATGEVEAGQTEEHTFTVGGGTVKCKKATFKDNVKLEKSAKAWFRATYGECTAFGLSANVAMHTCEYELTLHAVGKDTASVVNWNQGKNQEPGVEEKTCFAPTSITEAETHKAEEIEIEVPTTGCKVFVGKQGPLTELTFTNNTTTTVEVALNVKEIKSFSNGKGLGCPAKGELKGTYTGKSVAKNNAAGGSVQVKT
jgi:hypothetical protein